MARSVRFCEAGHEPNVQTGTTYIMIMLMRSHGTCFVFMQGVWSVFCAFIATTRQSTKLKVL